MFHERKLYNKINKIHERALRIIHKDSTSNFQELLIKSNSVSVHLRNLQLLLTEINKTINKLNASFMEIKVVEIQFQSLLEEHISGTTVAMRQQ